MTRATNRTVRQPRYMRDFVCAADKCIDNCCHRWRVDLDKRTYERYTREVTDGVLAPLIETHVRRNRHGGGDMDYGYIALRDDGTCPFLTLGQLCRVQKTLGAEALSFTCRHYPRMQSAIGGDLEQHAAMSCPEIARRIIADPQALEAEAREMPAEDILPRATVIRPGPAAERFGLLRSAAVALVDAHAPDVDAGAFAVVMLAQGVDEYDATAGGGGPELAPWLAARLRALALPAFAANFARVAVDPSIPLRLLKEIVIERLAEPGAQKTWPRYLQTIAECLHGLDYSDDDLERSLRGYQAAREGFAGFAASHPWLLRNLALYDATRNSLFLPGEGPALRQVLRFVIRYVYLRFLLTGLHALWREKFDVEHCVNAAYAFSRAIEHNPGFVGKIAALLEKQELHGAAGMAVLLKG
jgi:lysine-N-methylase